MRKTLFLLIAMALMLGLSNVNCGTSDSKTENPYVKQDDTLININGTAVDTNLESFVLDYGEGLITVEMDGWNWYANDFKLIEGHEVSVYGKIDDNLYETASIEASSVYDENLGTYFYANPTDEEPGWGYNYWVSNAVVPGETVVRGTVTSTNVKDRKFTLDIGPRELTIDTSSMPYNPLDDIGYQKIEKGDYVRLRGDMKMSFWQNHELMADSVIVLMHD
ncbi:MAG: hypothetical protein JXL81_03295 [Deltaproteobacteria bacterium]|nr:hypothetical protein [Deltaproteobacteria bacterium]